MIKNFPQRLEKLLTEANLTVSDLALLFGVKRPSINSWRRGSNPLHGKEPQLLSVLTHMEKKYLETPVPVYISRTERRAYLLKRSPHANAAIPKPRPPAKRRKVLVRPK